jgi:putative nucleotidyltransferase with HDIG domain
MTRHRIAAIILAAGYSSRMGRFKPLLPLNGQTVIERLIDTFQENDIHPVGVVTGHRAEDIHQAIHLSGVQFIENRAYASGMFSSVKAGIKRVATASVDAFFIAPADICLIRPLTIRLLTAAFQKRAGRIIYPCFKFNRGHPPLIPAALAASILDGQADSSLKEMLSKFEDLAVDIEVPDRHILIGMNHPYEYEDALLRSQDHDIPTMAECEILLTQVLNISEDIIRHSRKVEQIARKMGQDLQNSGALINLKLIRAAAMLHDIAKGHPHHAEAGSRMLSEMGFPKVAHIVSQLADLPFNPEAPISEAEILYLATCF